VYVVRRRVAQTDAVLGLAHPEHSRLWRGCPFAAALLGDDRERL